MTFHQNSNELVLITAIANYAIHFHNINVCTTISLSEYANIMIIPSKFDTCRGSCERGVWWNYARGNCDSWSLLSHCHFVQFNCDFMFNSCLGCRCTLFTIRRIDSGEFYGFLLSFSFDSCSCLLIRCHRLNSISISVLIVSERASALVGN